MIIFSRKDVERAVPMVCAIELMKSAFIQLSKGTAQVPVRSHLHLPEVEGQVLIMPAFLAENPSFGVKLVGIHERNPEKGLPFIHAMVWMMEAETGKPLALMDGTYLTALRTGAASGLATDLLARKNAKTLVIIGAGAQARFQFEAVCSVRDIQNAFIYNRTFDKAEGLANELTEAFDIPVLPLHNLDRLPEADVICTSTSSADPVFSADLISPGTHINAIGAYRADMAEIPPEIVQSARVVVDDKTACLKEAGDIIQAIEKGFIPSSHISGTLGEIVMEKLPRRKNPDEITLFKSVGNAAQDIAVAEEVVRVGRLKEWGTNIEF